jgi:hypothetical protein
MTATFRLIATLLALFVSGTAHAQVPERSQFLQ